MSLLELSCLYYSVGYENGCIHPSKGMDLHPFWAIVNKSNVC